MYLHKNVKLVYSKEDGGFLAKSCSIYNLFGFGKSKKKALQNLKEAEQFFKRFIKNND